MAKAKRATWWKMFYHQRAVFESISNEDAGAALKAAFRYFDGEELPDDLSSAAFIAFSVLRASVDEATQNYQDSVMNGKIGSELRWNNSPPKPPYSPPKDASGYDREADAEAEKKQMQKEADADFSPPSLDEVAAYCQERGKKINPEGFHSYYSAKGWKTGGDCVRDWKALVNAWEANSKGEDQKRSPAHMSSGKQKPLSSDEWDKIMEAI